MSVGSERGVRIVTITVKSTEQSKLSVPTYKPAHLGDAGRLEKPVREGQHQEEYRDDHPGGPHPPVGLIDAQPSDRVQPTAPDGEHLGQKSRTPTRAMTT